MKITHIVEASATGTLSMMALLANAQADAKHSVEVIYSNRSETPSDFEKLFHPEITLTNIQMNTTKDKFFCIPSLRKRLKHTSPKYIYLHSSFAGFLGRISSLFILPNTHVFYIPHCISFMRRDIGVLKKLIFIAFEWIGAIKPSTYIACSESEKKSISKNIPFRNCHLIENAIDISSIKDSFLLKEKVEITTVITVGQIRPQKGPTEFSIIASKARAIDKNIEFIWVGDGDSDVRTQLERAGVTVLGWVPKADVLNRLQRASIYLSTAKWEGMPVSIIEASFAGLPVVASKCAGNVDVISHGKTGWLFETEEEAINQILSIIKNPESSTKVATNAFNIAKNRFSVERYLKQMESLQ